MKTIKTIHIGGNQNIFILYIRRNILQWTRVGKLEESLGLEGLYMMREKEERRESISLGEKIQVCLQMRTEPP